MSSKALIIYRKNKIWAIIKFKYNNVLQKSEKQENVQKDWK